MILSSIITTSKKCVCHTELELIDATQEDLILNFILIKFVDPQKICWEEKSLTTKIVVCPLVHPNDDNQDTTDNSSTEEEDDNVAMLKTVSV
jgi:hypothetical protein